MKKIVNNNIVIEYTDIYENIGENMANSNCDGMKYTIKEGDTLYKISRANNIPLADILEANTNVNIYNLRVGDEICIPRIMPNNSSENMNSKVFIYVVRDDDTLNKILDRFNISMNDLLEANRQNMIMLKPGSAIMVPRE